MTDVLYGEIIKVLAEFQTKWGRGLLAHLNQPMVPLACVRSALKGEENNSFHVLVRSNYLSAPEHEKGPAHPCIPVYSPFPFLKSDKHQFSRNNIYTQSRE